MNKINNKKIIYNIIYIFGVWAILIFEMLVMPFGVYAEGGTNYNYNTFSGFNSSPYQEPTNPAPVYYSPAPVVVTPTIYSNSTNPNATKTTTTSKTVAKVTSAKKTDNTSDLLANAIYGSNGFMPSGLIQWILLAILLLLIIILVRKISKTDKKYQATPLKHA